MGGLAAGQKIRASLEVAAVVDGLVDEVFVRDVNARTEELSTAVQGRDQQARAALSLPEGLPEGAAPRCGCGNCAAHGDPGVERLTPIVILTQLTTNQGIHRWACGAIKKSAGIMFPYLDDLAS